MSNTEPRRSDNSAASSEHTAARQSDIDRTIRYTTRFNRTTGKCRLRAWLDERTFVITELADNPGMSVTNAVEHIAETIEALFSVRCTADREATYAPLVRLVEHYPPRGQLGISLAVVHFVGRDGKRPDGPTWGPLPADDWLHTALDERDDT